MLRQLGVATRGALVVWLVFTGGGAGAANEAASSCIQPIAYLPLDKHLVGADANGVAALGTYERVSPDGRFILRSYSGAMLGKVSLMELPANGHAPVRVYRTPFSNEAFPVQGSWRYLVDVMGEHYRFSDVVARQADARPLFQAGMTGFYAAASELKADEAVRTDRGPAPIRIRSLSWPQSADPDRQGVGPLQVETVEIQDDGRSARVTRTTGATFICSGRAPVDGSTYALPMLSVDGTEFSAIPQVPHQGAPSMRVYGLSKEPFARQHPCDLRADLGGSPSKAVFGYASSNDQPWLTYSDVGHIYVYDRQLQATFRLDHAKHGVLASAYPGLTRDGRVIYGATWRDCADAKTCGEQAGYVVVDPYQSSAYRRHWQERGQTPPRMCITTQEVAAERQRFAKLRGLTH